MTGDEYLHWHLFNHKDCTHVVLVKGRVIGIYGIAPEHNFLFFLTEEIPKELRSMLVRHFKEALDSLMKELGITTCYTIADANYFSSQKWAKRNGFEVVENFEQNGFKGEVMQYTINSHSDILSL